MLQRIRGVQTILPNLGVCISIRAFMPVSRFEFRGSLNPASNGFRVTVPS